MERKQNRWIAAVLTLCLLLGLCPFDLTVRAAETAEPLSAETSMETAKEVNFDEEVKFTLSAESQKQWFKVTTTEACQTVVIESLGEYGVDQETCAIRDEEGNSVSTVYMNNVSGLAFYARHAGTYYLYYHIFGSASDNGTVLNCAFKLRTYANDKYEPNDSMAEAATLPLGEERAIIAVGDDEDWFKVETTKQGQLIQLECSAENRVFAECYDASGNRLSGRLVSNGCIATGAAGTYYLRFRDFIQASGGRLTLYEDPTLICITMLDNDANEPNNTKQQATPLTNGATTEFTLAAGDYDYFKITTTKPGQDIALMVSGYDYTNKDQQIQLVFDPGSSATNWTDCGGYATLSGNSTLYFHAAEAGEHYVALYMYGNNNTNALCTRTLAAQILDGDGNEPNETKDTATGLTVGTDRDFTVGGFGDEDWFMFEAAPGEGEQKLYTLRFTGLNTDYSDSFYYDLYAPDGTAIVKQAKVNIQHVYGFSCGQQGQYYVRVYTVAASSKNYFWKTWVSGKGTVTMGYPRSTLRICVSEGSDDPYESNDTWQTAASIPVGDIQHVLASTTDADWFCFTVPENDMTLHLTGSKQTTAMLYKAETLMQNGEDANYREFVGNYGGINFGGTAGDLYWKLTDNGVYYLKLTADSSCVSADLRTTGLELLPATDEENNDTWKNATPLYEGVPQSFTISASNDVDWFKIVVPEDGTRLRFKPLVQKNTYSDCLLYKGSDFVTAGDNAGAVESWKMNTYHTTESLNKGAYYLRVRNSEFNFTPLKGTVIYSNLPVEQNTSLETAKQLEVGEWAEYYNNSYFYIGERKAGDVVRVSRDATGNDGSSVYVKDVNGGTIASKFYTNNMFTIPTSGIYYLYVGVQTSDMTDTNGAIRPNRIRYDVGSGEEKVSAIECVDTLTLIEGESIFLDLRCAPYDAMSLRGNEYNGIYRITTPSCMDYDYNTGYLTAKNAGSGILYVSLCSDSSVKKEIPVTVLAKDSLSATNVTIANAPATLSLGTSAELTANYTLTDGMVLTNPQSAVTWTSSDPKVLYVAPGGKVTAVGSGSATVTAAVGGVSQTVTIDVTAAEEPKDTVTSITLNKYSLTLYVGEAGEQLTTAILPEGSTASVVWQSSAPNAATVTSDGFVQAVAPGTSVVTATAGGRHVSCIVSVLPARVRVTGVSFADSACQLPMGGTTTLRATVSPSDATVKTLVWTSSDEDVATVSRTGIVTAVSVGETTICATSTDGGYYAEVKVTVTAAAQLGDVNKDGYIDSADAMLCLRAAVGLTELTAEQKTAADVNHDGFVDAGDAIKILRYDAKLIDKLD